MLKILFAEKGWFCIVADRVAKTSAMVIKSVGLYDTQRQETLGR